MQPGTKQEQPGHDKDNQGQKKEQTGTKQGHPGQNSNRGIIIQTPNIFLKVEQVHFAHNVPNVCNKSVYYYIPVADMLFLSLQLDRTQSQPDRAALSLWPCVTGKW